MSDSLDILLSATDLVAVLGREVPVRLLELSGTGCKLESKCRLGPGVTARLRIEVDGTEYTEDVRVTRCQECEGASGAYHLGAEYLWTTSPHERSLRRAIAKMTAGLVTVIGFETSM